MTTELFPISKFKPFKDMSETNTEFSALLTTIKTLRDEDGCPWDRKQTTQSLRKYLVEEFNEILAAIDEGDAKNLCEELGDFLYLILMIGEINGEVNNFTVAHIIRSINSKLIRRHPHVFTEQKELSEPELRHQWEAIKRAEKSSN